jgi:hypothetical protein
MLASQALFHVVSFLASPGRCHNVQLERGAISMSGSDDHLGDAIKLLIGEREETFALEKPFRLFQFRTWLLDYRNEARCVVPDCDGASLRLIRQGEDALWQAFFTAAPVRRRGARC